MPQERRSMTDSILTKIPSTANCRERLSDYLVARQQHREANRAFKIASKSARRLCQRMSEDRAWEMAGTNLADHRSLRAYRRQSDARAALLRSMVSEAAIIRLQIMGVLWCEHIPTPQNDNGRPCRPWIELSSNATASLSTWLGRYGSGSARYYPAANAE
jgi:hypothetical protein